MAIQRLYALIVFGLLTLLDGANCMPAAATVTHTPSTSNPLTSTVVSSTVAPAPSCAVNHPSISAGKLRFAGVNIAGFDFGCGTDGTCTVAGAWPPLAQYYGYDGAGQMKHFVQNDGYNIFRLPVGWQYLTGNDTTAVSTLNATNFAEYDALVQACLSTGAHCIIDIHNYARFNGGIVGQGGPDNSVLAGLWSSIAKKYAHTPNVIFGVMNEPHDVPDITLWAASVQAVVTAIRRAGATTQLILLPGNNWTSAQTFVSSGSADALNKVRNPDGTKLNLIFDVHKYLDSDNSGSHPDCVTNNIDDSWAPLAQWLRCHGRQALNTETGGGNVADCVTFMSQQIAFQAANSDVFLGYLGWSAGNFDPTYTLAETPTENGTTWTDTMLVSSALSPKVNKLVVEPFTF
ncbi:endo-beta-1,4-glucanase [Artomyces pyxidatus]|uniref:Endo-beta-1,4-glucanase n=1 Tax=Artomyces pyxidatus TaxID=48021 RepID=A0ACB8SNT5_9AGAM|nr:endo-beta-1,4-glucanase [Artomyces pyxidatus]